MICTRNRATKLRECLAAILLLDPAPVEVLIVDNTSGDEATRSLASSFGANYTIEPSPGLSRARNRGVAECKSEIVAFLDDDAVPDVKWLGALVAPFADCTVAATTGKIRTPDSNPNDAAQQSYRVLSNEDPQWFEIATFGGLGLGSNMALRKSACAGHKIFDERLGRGAPFQIGEESYAFAVLLSRGYKAAFLPSAMVFHPAMRRGPLEQEARNSITYWLLLFCEFPARRIDLLSFLIRRLRRKRLTWVRDPQGPGEIINSSFRVKCKAAFAGLILFLKTKRPASH